MEKRRISRISRYSLNEGKKVNNVGLSFLFQGCSKRIFSPKKDNLNFLTVYPFKETHYTKGKKLTKRKGKSDSKKGQEKL